VLLQGKPKGSAGKTYCRRQASFLDFVLGTDGQSDKNKISALMGVVKGIVARDNGPYVIFAWTKHNQPQDDLFGAFKKAIMNDKDFPSP